MYTRSRKNQNEDGNHKLLRHQYLFGRKSESVGNKLWSAQVHSGWALNPRTREATADLIPRGWPILGDFSLWILLVGMYDSGSSRFFFLIALEVDAGWNAEEEVALVQISSDDGCHACCYPWISFSSSSSSSRRLAAAKESTSDIGPAPITCSSSTCQATRRYVLMGLILSPSSFSLPIAIHWLLPDFACTQTKGSLNPKLPLL